MPGRETDVIAAPYDVISRDEARAGIARRPDSLLTVTRADALVPPGVSPYDPSVYATARESLRRLVRQGLLLRDSKPLYYAYRAQTADHSQTGIVCLVHEHDYASGRIRRHEFTRPDKETDRVRTIVDTGTFPEPVMLAHRHSAVVEAALSACRATTPLADVVDDDGVRHTLWGLDFTTIAPAIEAMPMFYVADGHHRCEAAVRAAAEIDARDGVADGDHHWFPAVIFDEAVVRILPYHRLLRNVEPRLIAGIDDALRARGTVTPIPKGEIPPRGAFAVYTPGAWRRLTPPPADASLLDVDLLAREVLQPIFGITDQRSDSRLDFVGGTRGLGALEEAVNSGAASMAIAVHPTALAGVFQVSDAGGVMPPKSTWFAPKLISGLFLHAFTPLT